MSDGFLACLQIFPTSDIDKTTKFYESIGFRSVKYLEAEQPHVCLYRDKIELIITKSKMAKIEPNRVVHGYGYDAYFITGDQKSMLDELKHKGVRIIKDLARTDYANDEFVFEDIDGRWIGVGMKASS